MQVLRLYKNNDMKKVISIFLLIAGISLSSNIWGHSILAFPTAQGFGKYATGGRGGKVVEVTTLHDSVDGSLRWALRQYPGEPLTVVFRVGGIITLGSDIRCKRDDFTIAGQTAPGSGILIRGAKLNFGGSTNLVIRNIRVRIGLKDDAHFIAGGSMGIENASNVIIDHCCFGWSAEENVTMYDNHFTTVQWCILHEGLYNAGHHKGSRSYGAQWGGSPATYCHNLLAHNHNRSARLNGANNPHQDRKVLLEYINNVNYNWGKQNSCYGGENEAGPNSQHECNFIGNYYKPGPGTPTSGNYFIELSAPRNKYTMTGPSKWYFSGNKMVDDKRATSNNWEAIHNNTGYSIDSLKSETLLYPTSFYPETNSYNYNDYKTTPESADAAYLSVLAKVGTINRDVVEKRVVDEVAKGIAKYSASLGVPGYIDSPADAEDWPVYKSGTPVTDADHDGIDDAWELKHGLDPKNPKDGNAVVSKDGYTALEVYLCSLMGETIPITKGIVKK